MTKLQFQVALDTYAQAVADIYEMLADGRPDDAKQARIDLEASLPGLFDGVWELLADDRNPN